MKRDEREETKIAAGRWLPITIIRSLNSMKLVISVIAVVLMAVGCVDSSPPPVKVLPTRSMTNSIGMKLVLLPGGTFNMGDKKEEPPVHAVTVDPFWIGQYEVTNAEYDLFRKRPRPPESLTNRQPETRLSWDEAVQFCQWLSKREGRHYRLPTEAEWEFAARGGLDQKQYPWGDEDPEGRATFGMPTTTVVGSYAPNGFGLYDMAGNIDEWVSDWYDPDYYNYSPRFNPKGPTKGDLKITRGGFHPILEITVAMRRPVPPDLNKVPEGGPGTGNFSGFRVVMEVENQR